MNHAEAEALADKIMDIVMEGSIFYQAGIAEVKHKITQLIMDPGIEGQPNIGVISDQDILDKGLGLEQAKICEVCNKEHRKSEIIMVGQTRLIPGHEYQIVTNTPRTRYARSWRMGFLGTGAVSSRDLQFSARGPDRSTAGQYAGTQVLDKRFVVRAREVERNDAERYVARRLTADNGESY